MRLDVGDRFKILEGDKEVWEVIAVGLNATVRPLAKRRHKFETYDGKQIDFEAPVKGISISRNSDVFLVEEEKLEDESFQQD